MDRNALSSKRRQQGAQPSTKPPIRIARDKRQQQEATRRSVSGRIKTAKDSSEIIRVPRKADGADRPSLEDDPNARHFTVANVGRNGTLYLKPSRMNPANFTQAPATPPGTSDGPEDVPTSLWLDTRQSNVSGTWTPRAQVARSSVLNHPVALPPLSMANPHQRRRTRSHSFSTAEESVRSPTFDSGDFQVLLNGRDASQRPKSSVDLSAGYLDLRIPHYRLGTPRFSDRGTAYLHNSIYTSISEDMRSSVFSRAEYDKLFPAPPGREHGPSFISRQSSSQYLHPSHATLTPSRTPPTPVSPQSGLIYPGVYDRVEANINDPTLVRYSPVTGRITAATPARLIAQITSPLFLDYELLADFFLTFRNFLSCGELLEYLFGRMKWALANDSDAGRIVRVRTFVALRHWILNYFADDFLLELPFRQRFCDLVNELAHSLQQRHDQGGTDMNVIGELKKCWRRTCAMFWPVPDALDTSADADILPGQEHATPRFGASATSLPLSVQRQGSRMDFRRGSEIQLPVESAKAVDTTSDTQIQHMRTASIPTSPMSEQSLTVLSCSVPFLRNMMPSKEKSNADRPPGPRRNPPLPEKPARSAHGHKRSGSFSDALRDQRPPLPSNKPESIDIRSLPAVTFTGGLVRGLLLQPSPSKVDILIPLSPTLETREVRFAGLETASYHDRQQQNAGVKKIVGDVRRVLSSRKGRRESPTSSHRSTDSSESRHAEHVIQHERSAQVSAWQELRGPPRVDRLGEQIVGSYKEAFQDPMGQNTATPHLQSITIGRKRSEIGSNKRRGLPKAADMHRLDSHVTAGSRSIVIVDDTGVPEMPAVDGALPSVSSWSSGMAPKPLLRSPEQAFDYENMEEYRPGSGSPTAVASEGQQPDAPTHDLLAVPDIWQAGVLNIDTGTEYVQARKSSNVHPSALDLEPMRHQLRRRPGGDLKAADNVHDLEPLQREHTDSYSTFSQALTSATASHDLSGTHFSGQEFRALKLRDPSTQDIKSDSVNLLPTHSSQPNMRPSFEKQVSNLAQLPDQQYNDGGGIEDALAKLEGKASSLTESDSTAAERTADSSLPPLSRQDNRFAPLHVVNVSGEERPSVDESQIRSPRTDRQGASIYCLSGWDAESEQFITTDAHNVNTSPPSTLARSKDLPLQGTEPVDRSKKILILDDKTEAMDHAVNIEASEKWDSEPRSAGTPKGSFLLDDNESLSDISTEIADQSGDESLGVRSFFFDDTLEDEGVGVGSFRPPPTPPSTTDHTTGHSPERSPVLTSPTLASHSKQLKEAASAPKLLPSSNRLEAYQRPGELRRVRTLPSQKKTAHLPFIMAFESDVIAEQMTIIEKDALDEVDWKGLIGLCWQQNPPHVRNWVEFLKEESNGIDIVIARFNLVVQWVVSECLLTEAPSERARCITKFIHIAAHCHHLRNYASMYQITLALLSSDLARLHQTWALVAPAEKQMLERFERLCQPLRNFHHLRSEMEAASTERGCIPFIGLYTHDLMFNAQKPSRIDPTPPGKEKLVNFERYQTAAMIVKSLLRLIEASSKYIFHPHPEVLSRCLWLAALEDGEITARSKNLEQSSVIT